MRRRKHGLACLLVMLLVVTILGGCGSGNNEGTTVEPDSSSSSVTPSQEATTNPEDEKPVELVFWNYPVWNLPDQKPGEYAQTLIEKFEKKYPNVKVKLEIIPYDGGDQKVNVALASKTAPDILNDSPGRTTSYAKRGYTVPLNDILTEEQLKKIPQNVLEKVTLQDGTIFSYPQGLGATLMVINKSLVERAGAADLLPSGELRTWTIEQFEKLLVAVREYQKKVTPDHYPFLMFGLNEQGDALYHSFMAGFGGKRYSDDRTQSTFSSTENVQAVEWFKSLIDKQLVYPNPETRAAGMSNDYFVQEKTAVAFGGFSLLNAVQKAKDEGAIKGEFEAILAPFPSVKEDQGVVIGGGGQFVIFDNGDENKIKYAKKFIQFAQTEDPDFIKAMNAFDVYGRDTLGANPDPEKLWLSKLVTDTEHIIAIDGSYDIEGYSQTRAVFFPEMQAVFIGAKEPLQAMQDYDEKANKIIKDAIASKK